MVDLQQPLQRAVENALTSHFPTIKELTSQQQEIIKAIFLRRQDVFAVLPTGHGKSLPFFIAPVIAKELGRKNADQSFKNKDIVVVISPLLAIMELQVKALNAAGIPPCFLNDESIESVETLGNYNIIFGTPEAWINKERWLKIVPLQRVLLIVADEAHYIPKWAFSSLFFFFSFYFFKNFIRLWYPGYSWVRDMRYPVHIYCHWTV